MKFTVQWAIRNYRENVQPRIIKRVANKCRRLLEMDMDDAIVQPNLVTQVGSSKAYLRGTYTVHYRVNAYRVTTWGKDRDFGRVPDYRRLIPKSVTQRTVGGFRLSAGETHIKQLRADLDFTIVDTMNDAYYKSVHTKLVDIVERVLPAHHTPYLYSEESRSPRHYLSFGGTLYGADDIPFYPKYSSLVRRRACLHPSICTRS